MTHDLASELEEKGHKEDLWHLQMNLSLKDFSARSEMCQGPPTLNFHPYRNASRHLGAQVYSEEDTCSRHRMVTMSQGSTGSRWPFNTPQFSVSLLELPPQTSEQMKKSNHAL